MSVLIEMIDAAAVEAAGAVDEAMDFLAFVE
jgi:hypothetical protein